MDEFRNPALWSAVAAIFSAVSSIMMMLIHRRNLIESVRSSSIQQRRGRNVFIEKLAQLDTLQFLRETRFVHD
jgi:hypothetical protein